MWTGLILGALVAGWLFLLLLVVVLSTEHASLKKRVADLEEMFRAQVTVNEAVARAFDATEARRVGLTSALERLRPSAVVKGPERPQ